MFAATEKEMQLLGRAASEFARDVLIPERELHDRFPFGPFFEKIVDKAFELDFFHLILPEELEGTGMGIAALCRLLGELAREDASLAAIIFTTNVAHSILLAAGEVQMLRELSTDAKHAQEFLIAFPVFNNPSEIAPKVFAEQTSGKFKLQGQVDYLVLGSIARYGLIPAFIEKSPLYSLFLVDLQKPSAQVSDPVLSLGLHACPAVDVVFDGTNSRQVGNIGSGPAYFETGTAKLHLAAFNYIDTTIGPYGELAVAAPAVYGKQTTASSGIFPALMESNYSGFGVVVLHLPVTHEKARDGGRVGWGYTKFIADMHFTLRPEYMQCRMLEKDTHILDLRLRRKGIYVRDRKPLTTYSVKDRQLIKTVVPQTATKRISLLTGGSYVRLGSHPMAESIKALDLAPKPFMSVYYPERGAILPAGQVIANNVEPLEGYYGETREAEHIITYAGDTAVPN